MKRAAHIKKQADIAHIISAYVELQMVHRTRRSSNAIYYGACPFHDDHRPSLCVDTHRKLYKCFSCGAGGDVIDFVMRYEQTCYARACRIILKRCSVRRS